MEAGGWMFFMIKGLRQQYCWNPDSMAGFFVLND